MTSPGALSRDVTAAVDVRSRGAGPRRATGDYEVHPARTRGSGQRGKVGVIAARGPVCSEDVVLGRGLAGGFTRGVRRAVGPGPGRLQRVLTTKLVQVVPGGIRIIGMVGQPEHPLE